MTWLRGRVLHCLAEPGSGNQAVEYFEDAVMQIDAGRIAELLPTREAASKGLDPLLCKPVAGLIVPGFIDTHVHAPQLDIIGSYGEQLLAWLERYTFPAEERFADPDLAEAGMNRFLEDLRKRKIFQWTVAYAAGAWVTFEIISQISDTFALDAAVSRVAFVVLATGVPACLVLAWFHGEKGRQKVGVLEACCGPQRDDLEVGEIRLEAVEDGLREALGNIHGAIIAFWGQPEPASW